jgi:hypothetical protein
MMSLYSDSTYTIKVNDIKVENGNDTMKEI